MVFVVYVILSCKISPVIHVSVILLFAWQLSLYLTVYFVAYIFFPFFSFYNSHTSLINS